MEIIKEKTCAFSGHRNLKENFSQIFLEENILNAIERGYDTFLVGMALGFDTKAFLVLEKLRKKYKIKIIACIPCSEQPDKFSFEDKENYYKMIKSADEQILISPSYYKGCMQKRNRFMVDNCSLLIAYLTENKGGTFTTCNYAEKKGVEIILV